ncbi:transposase [Candidatus Woesearchaeota archaeon]|nr:transposase [Candidatus Woesearchaeota archaeon]
MLHLDSHRKTGLVVILHTFGKDMKFHPHLHIITNSNIDFNFKFSKLWRKTVLDSLKLSSNEYYYGYYVWSNNIESKNIAKYIGRYVRHPAIANGRIIRYNKRDIIFFYKDSKGKRILVRKSVLDFITCLIQHIPPRQFKMIRYYGAYNKNSKGI